MTRAAASAGKALLILAGIAALGAPAVRSAQSDTVEAYIAAATATAGDDFKGILSLCVPRAGAPEEPSLAEPVKVFDNLYFLGMPFVSAWALTTSAGIIVIDSLDNAQEAQVYIEGGLRKLGLDPREIKYVIVTHAHLDHSGGAQYLAEKFRATIVMSDQDWDLVAGRLPGRAPGSSVPRNGKSVEDGETLTLGDTRIEFVATPPHTLGTMSLILPLKDGGLTHVGAEWGGTAFNFAPTVENFTAYIASAQKFARIARERGADVPLSNHAGYDDAFQKIAALKQRRAGAPNPFVMGTGATETFLAVAAECAMAMRERVRSAAPG